MANPTHKELISKKRCQGEFVVVSCTKLATRQARYLRFRVVKEGGMKSSLALTLLSRPVFLLAVWSCSSGVTPAHGNPCPASFSASSAGCSLSSSCGELTCPSVPAGTAGYSLDVTVSVVDNCSDPVRVSLVMSGLGQCQGVFEVNGRGEVSRPLLLDSQNPLSAHFTRNASHLHFTVQHKV